MIKNFLLITILILSTNAIAKDEIVLIQAVSSSQKTFAIRKGHYDGIDKGQDSLFTNKNSSFAATAIEVNRHFSVWEIKDKRGQVPFQKGDFITYTNSIENVWTEIPKLHLKPTDELAFKAQKLWVIQGNYSTAFSESVSETDSNRYTGRTGIQFEAYYAKQYDLHWEYQVGFRFDRENSSLSEPQIDVPTQRNMIAANLLYHFEKFKRSDDNAYLGIGLAYGLSNTTVDETVSTGTAYALPILKVGYLNRVADDYSLTFELVIESISSNESFTDTPAQQTNIVNSKFGIGVRF